MPMFSTLCLDIFVFVGFNLQVSELGLELEERDGGIYVTDVQEHGCVAVHGLFLFSSPIQSRLNLMSY